MIISVAAFWNVFVNVTISIRGGWLAIGVAAIGSIIALFIMILFDKWGKSLIGVKDEEG